MAILKAKLGQVKEELSDYTNSNQYKFTQSKVINTNSVSTHTQTYFNLYMKINNFHNAKIWGIIIVKIMLSDKCNFMFHC